MFKFFSKRAPLLRAIAVVGATGALVTSVTYATLQSPTATLTGNTINSATATLLVGTASASSTAFGATHSGFTFGNVVPGGPAMPASGNVFYLRNTGTATLAVKLAVGGTPTNTYAVDLSKVTVNITRADTSTSQSATLQSLIDNGLALTDTMAPNASSTAVQYTLSVSMTADAFTGSSASIGGIDLVFSGSAAL
jgi:hypothetical protein